MNRKVIIPVLLSVLMAGLAYAQGPRYVELRPVRTVSIGGTLGDIESQLPAGNPYRDPDLVTSGHEQVHGINARLRDENRSENGFYCLNDRGFLCPSPKLTLSEVARATPQSKRGRIFKLYVVDSQRWWNDTPLYVLDECCAYVSGSKVGLELNMKARSLYSFQNAVECWHYTRVAARLARQRGYRHADELDAFLDEFHRDGIHYLLCEYKKRGWR